MTTQRFLDRIIRIKEKDKRQDVIFDILKMDVEMVIEMIYNVDDALLDEEILEFKVKIGFLKE